SRVGARISARVVIGAARPLSSERPARIGRLKAAVLPEPVWAMPMMSLPCSCGEMACAWIGVGVLKPALVRPATRWAGRPRSVNVLVKEFISYLAARQPIGAPGLPASLAGVHRSNGDRDLPRLRLPGSMAPQAPTGALRRSPHWPIRRE